MKLTDEKAREIDAAAVAASKLHRQAITRRTAMELAFGAGRQQAFREVRDRINVLKVYQTKTGTLTMKDLRWLDEQCGGEE